MRVRGSCVSSVVRTDRDARGTRPALSTYVSAEPQADAEGGRFLADGGFAALQLPGDLGGGIAARVSA